MYDQSLPAKHQSLPDKPLHVQVAEALGETMNFGLQPWEFGHYNPRWLRRLKAGEFVRDLKGPFGRAIQDSEEFWGEPIRYDTDWAATGPLIEKYRICTHGPSKMSNPPQFAGWGAYVRTMRNEKDERVLGGGDTPLMAICNLLIALGAAGKPK